MENALSRAVESLNKQGALVVKQFLDKLLSAAIPAPTLSASGEGHRPR
jgi:hypothetical protein